MSRETELYKDKIEVSLDGRQIFYLFFGGAVIVGMVFVLGVMVGRRVEARGHVERAHVEATVDPLAALDRLEGGNGLSFQGALRGAESPVADVDKQIAEMAAAKKPEAKIEAKKPEPKAEEPKPEAKPEAKIEKKVEDKKSDDKKSEDKKAEAKADAPKPKAEDKKSDDKQADKKSDEKKSEKKLEAKADEPKAEKKQKFTLQLSSFKDRDEAEAFLDQVKAAGYTATMTKADVDGKQFYRVRMGTYSSADAANEAKAEFEKSAKKSALVTKL
jgi:cell division protein FtsN